MNTRPLTEQELKILNVLLSQPFPGRDELKKQLENTLAKSTEDSDNYGSAYLLPDKNSSTPAAVSLRVPVEALVNDADGSAVDILLHVVDGFLNELEVVRLDGSPLKQAIDTDKLEVTVNS